MENTKIIKLLTFSSFMFFCLSAHSQARGCTGETGDIKSSVLAETNFRVKNGHCWVLMDGRDISGTELAVLAPHLKNRAPNSQGLFLRSIDNAGVVDAKNRLSGNTQGDEVKSHVHRVTLAKSDGSSGKPWGNPDGAKDSYNKGDWRYQYWRGYLNDKLYGSTTATNAPFQTPPFKHETRPKNMAVFMYIHVGGG